MYIDQLRGLEGYLGLRSGIEYVNAETLSVDVPALRQFVSRMRQVLTRTNNRVLVRLVSGACEVTVALLNSATGERSEAPKEWEWQVDTTYELRL